MNVKSLTWSDRFGGLPNRKPFEQAIGAKSGQDAGNLAVFGLVKLNVALGLLEKAGEMHGFLAIEKRRQGCMALLEAAKALLDSGKWAEAFEAASALKTNMQEEDKSSSVDGQSMQAKVIEVARWKPVNGAEPGENQRIIADIRAIACEFVHSERDKEQYKQEIKEAV